MANSPDQPEAPDPPKREAVKRAMIKRDPAKHSKKDPAKPTRAKANRPDSAPTDPALAELLNPGIRQGTAGIGSQTGQSARRGDEGASGLRPLCAPLRLWNIAWSLCGKSAGWIFTTIRKPPA